LSLAAEQRYQGGMTGRSWLVICLWDGYSIWRHLQAECIADGDGTNLAKQARIFKIVQKHIQNFLGDCWLGTRLSGVSDI